MVAPIENNEAGVSVRDKLNQTIVNADAALVALLDKAPLLHTHLIADLPATISSIDTTAGRLLKVGDYGLPASLNLGAGDNLNTLTVSGFYYNTTAANTPGNNYPISSAGSLLNIRRSGTGWTQTFYAYAGASSLATAIRVFTRTQGGAGWSPWVEVFNQGTILGTVSQTTGVPTGAVIERGSNANGAYARFADGTQICNLTTTISSLAISTAYIGGFRSDAQTWTFPAVFVVAPDVSALSILGTAFGMSSFGDPTTTTAPYLFTAVTSQTAADRKTSLIAVGRWF